MKTILKNLAFGVGLGFLAFLVGALYGATESHYRYVMVSLLLGVGFVLLGLGFLLWRVLLWLERIASALGCVPARTRRINQLMKKLRDSDGAPPEKRITEAENAELGDLTTADWHDEPAKTAQMVRIIELLFSSKEYQRPETAQLQRIIELLTEMKVDREKGPKPGNSA
jgi:hypothetical protein